MNYSSCACWDNCNVFAWISQAFSSRILQNGQFVSPISILALLNLYIQSLIIILTSYDNIDFIDLSATLNNNLVQCVLWKFGVATLNNKAVPSHNYMHAPLDFQWPGKGQTSVADPENLEGWCIYKKLIIVLCAQLIRPRLLTGTTPTLANEIETIEQL